MSSKKFSWLSIWLIIFGASCLVTNVLFLSGMAKFSTSPIYYGFSAILSLLILFVGFKSLSSKTRGTLSDNGGLGWIADIYRNSWKLLWKEKWLLLVFGTVALTNTVLSIVQYFDIRKTMIARWHGPHNDMMDQFIYGHWSFADLIMQFPKELAGEFQRSLRYLVPRLELNSPRSITPDSIFVIAVAVFLIVIIARKVTALTSGPELKSKADFVRKVLIASGILALYFTAFESGLLNSPLVSRLNPILLYCWSFVILLVLKPTVMGFVVGSLKHCRNGEQVTIESVALDTVRYYKPLAGVGLVLMLFYWAIGLFTGIGSHQAPVQGFWLVFVAIVGSLTFIADLLTIFAAYVVVNQGVDAVKGILTSLQMWRKDAFDLLSFFVVGLTFITTAITLMTGLKKLVPMMSSVTVVYYPFIAALYMLISAFMFVSIWELYHKYVEQQVEQTNVEQ